MKKQEEILREQELKTQKIRELEQQLEMH